MSAATRAEAARDVLAAWDAASGRYTLLHGLEEDGEVGRDLDILVPVGEARKLLSIARRILESAGFSVGETSAVWGERMIAARGGWDSAMEFHTVTTVTWRNIIFARWTNERDDKWPSFAKRVLLPLLANPARNFQKALGAFADFRSSREVISEKCRQFFGSDATARLFDALEKADPSLCKVPALRKTAIRRHVLKHPFQSACSITWQVLRRFIAVFSPCAPVIAVVGPDGVGKSTLLSLLSSGSKSIFTKIVIRHWRPGLLPNLGSRRPVSPPAGLAVPRRKAGRFPWIRAGYYYWDFFLGHWLVDRPDTCLQRLVVYDRCALDMSVDPLRYGVSSVQAARWMWRLSPKPDLVILLDGDPVAIHARKPELPVDEIAAQLAAWRAYVTDGTVGAVIDTAMPADAVAAKVRDLAMGALMKKLRATAPMRE